MWRGGGEMEREFVIKGKNFIGCKLKRRGKSLMICRNKLKRSEGKKGGHIWVHSKGEREKTFRTPEKVFITNFRRMRRKKKTANNKKLIDGLKKRAHSPLEERGERNVTATSSKEKV